MPATFALAIVGTWVILKIMDALVGLRVSEEDELVGLHLSQHSETAYAFAVGSYSEFASGTGGLGEPLRPAEAKARPAH